MVNWSTQQRREQTTRADNSQGRCLVAIAVVREHSLLIKHECQEDTGLRLRFSINKLMDKVQQQQQQQVTAALNEWGRRRKQESFRKRNGIPFLKKLLQKEIKEKVCFQAEIEERVCFES